MQSKNFQALCDLSDAKTHLSPKQLTRIIHAAPDPETATQAIFANFTSSSTALSRAWRRLINEVWSAKHPDVPILLNLPLTTHDVSDVPAVTDALSLLQLISAQPPRLVYEDKEWLLSPPDAHYLVSRLPSLHSSAVFALENEWQYLSLRRLREVLHSLRLVRRVKDRLVVVKSRYQRFNRLPLIYQYYLLWHTEAYHVSWADFAGIWGEYLLVIQEFLPLLWDLSEGATADMPRDIRAWHQDLWEAFSPLWEQAGLLERPAGQAALFSLIRVRSLPTALTQALLRDLLERYSLVAGEGDLYAWSTLGIKLTSAERTQELPCALELIQ